MEQLLHFLQTIHPLTPESIAHLATTLKERQIEKKQFLLKAGHISQNVCFIQKGLLRCFYLKDDKEVSTWFMKEGDVIFSVESFLLQVVSKESIQAIEDTHVYYITYNELQHIYRTYPEFNFIGRILTEKYYALSEQRLYSLRMQKSQERYDFLLNYHPELVQRAPAKYLASYLGIAEGHLSRIKGY